MKEEADRDGTVQGTEVFRNRIMTEIRSRLVPHREILIRTGGRMRRISIPLGTQVTAILLVTAVCAWGVFVTDAYFEEKGVYEPSPSELRARSRMDRGLPRNLQGDRPTVGEETIIRAIAREDGPNNWANARRIDLIAYASSLDHWVQRLQDRNMQLSEELQRVGAEHAALKERKNAISSENLALRNGFGDLESRFSLLKSVQSEFVRQIIDSAGAEVRRMESLIAATGLDVGLYVPNIRPVRPAQGGPFEAAGAGAQDELVLETAAEEARRILHRVQQLKNFMRQLPIAPPLDHYSVSSAFGPRKDPINGRRAMHNGLDMKARYRETIHAPAAGRVTYAGRKGRFGRYIEIDHENGIVTRYGHLRQILVKRGDTVSARDRIGQVGNSGRSTGTHLHYEILVNGKAVNPAKFIEAGRHVFKG